MNIRENFLRTLEFNKPEWIPCIIAMSGIVEGKENKYGKKLENIKNKYKGLFDREIRPEDALLFQGLGPAYKIGKFEDSWGCVWQNTTGTSEGQVIEHPLEDWSYLKKYKAPDPLATRTNEWGSGTWDWNEIEKDIIKRKKEGKIIWGNGERLFDRLYFLRGFENLMMDIATDDPNLPKLIEQLWDYEKKLIDKWLEIGVDIIWFHTDIGTQKNLMIRPEKFRKYLKPMFKDLFGTCRDAGTHVYLSTDGRVIDIVDDFIECGVSIHDPQTGAISNEEIAKSYKGKIGIFLDLDRQHFPFYTPDELDEIIKKSVDMLNTPEGGLIVMAAICDPVPVMPIENIEAICKAFLQYCYKER